jgi:hypothetical protein
VRGFGKDDELGVRNTCELAAHDPVRVLDVLIAGHQECRQRIASFSKVIVVRCGCAGDATTFKRTRFRKYLTPL